MRRNPEPETKVKVKIKGLTVRFEVTEGLFNDIENLRKQTPIQDRLNRSAFIRKILIEYVNGLHGKKERKS